MHTASSKSGLHGLARNLAVELGPCHIRVNTVVAGGIKTARYYARPEIQNSPHNKNPLGDIAEFQDIANAAYFLADNEQARIITGAELAVDGGSLAQFVYEGGRHQAFGRYRDRGLTRNWNTDKGACI